MGREHNLARSSWLAALQAVWTTLILLAVYRCITGAFGLAVLGVWSTAVAGAALLTIADGGLSDVMVRQVSEAVGRRDWTRARALHRALTLWSLPGLLIGAALLLPLVQRLLSPAAPAMLVPVLPVLIVGATASAVLNVVGAGQIGVLESLGRYDLRLLIAVISGIVMLLVALTAARLRQPALVALAFVAGGVVQAGGAGIAGRHLLAARGGTDARLRGRELLALLRVALPVRLAGMLNLGLEPVTRAVLARTAGVESVALYEIAYRVVMQMRSVLVAAMQTLVPHLARLGFQAGDRHRSAVVGVAACGVAAAVPAMCLACLVLPAVAVIVLGRADPQLLPMGLLLASSWLVNIVAAPAYFANLAQGRVHRNWVAQGVSCLVNLLAAPLAGAALGAIGVVAVLAVAVTAGSAATLASRSADARLLWSRLAAADWLALGCGALLTGGLAMYWQRGSTGNRLMLLAGAASAAYALLVGVPAARRVARMARGLAA
jgi:O-antigen/teichoic acid export membrane protein